jgi:hypothetical protein
VSLVGRLLRRLVKLLVGPLVAWVNDNAFPVAGGVAAVLAGTVIYGRLRTAGAFVGPDPGLDEVVPSVVWAVLGASPAYALAVLVGVAVLVFWRR